MKQETVDPNTRFTVHAKSHLRLIALSLVCYTKTLCTMTCNEAFNTAPKTLCAIQVERNPLVGSGAARGGWGGGEGDGGGQQDYILFAPNTALHQSSGAV